MRLVREDDGAAQDTQEWDLAMFLLLSEGSNM
jgi:hypothetical protein